MFRYFHVIVIIACAIIPLVNLVDISLQIRLISAIIGAIVTGITALIEKVPGKLVVISVN